MKARTKRSGIKPWLVVARYADGSHRNFWRTTKAEADSVLAWAMTHQGLTEVRLYDRTKRTGDGPPY